MYCPSCGSDTPAGARFCACCGAAITAPRPTGYSGAGVSGASLAPPISAPLFSGARYAGFWRRFLAVVLDAVIAWVASVATVVPLAFAFGLVAGGLGRADPSTLETAGEILGVAVSIVVSWIYEAGLLSSARQATPGKMALEIVVTDDSGARVSFGRATGRHFAKYLSGIFLLVGFLIQPFTDKKQALHDLMAGTLVVRK